MLKEKNKFLSNWMQLPSVRCLLLRNPSMAPIFLWIAGRESSILKRWCTQTSIYPLISCQLALKTRMIQQRRYDATLASPRSLELTSLSEFHIVKGAKMVPFAGYLMPVQYNDLSVGDSHKWTREKASLFDVGHMYALLSSTLTRKVNSQP